MCTAYKYSAHKPCVRRVYVKLICVQIVLFFVIETEDHYESGSKGQEAESGKEVAETEQSVR